MNGVDFPVARVLDGIEAAREAGLAPIKVNMVVKKGENEASIVPMARWARDEGLILRFIEYMDVGTTNGWRLDDVVTSEEIVAAIDRELPLEPAMPDVPRRGCRALDVPRRVGRDRCHLVGQPAVLRRLHAGATVRRGQAVHLPVQRRRHGPAGADARGRQRRRAAGARRGCLVGAGRSLLRAPVAGHEPPPAHRDVRRRRLRPRQRDPRPAWSALTRSGEASYPPGVNSVENSWKRPRPSARNSWISGLPRLRARVYIWSCPKGPSGDEETRDHIKGTRVSGRSLRALRYPVATGLRVRPRVVARRDVTGIPVSVLPSGGRSLRAPVVYPWTSSRRPA